MPRASPALARRQHRFTRPGRYTVAVRTQDGRDFSYEVRFAIDEDLGWRIEAF